MNWVARNVETPEFRAAVDHFWLSWDARCAAWESCWKVDQNGKDYPDARAFACYGAIARSLVPR